jgi:hypothetical protein
MFEKLEVEIKKERKEHEKALAEAMSKVKDLES